MCAPSAPHDSPTARVFVWCLKMQADTFFLAVHEREDPSLVGRPVALWQFNDVICAMVERKAHQVRAVDALCCAG